MKISLAEAQTQVGELRFGAYACLDATGTLEIFQNLRGRLTPDQSTGGPRIWNDQSGSPRASFEVTANTVRFLSSRSEMEGGGGAIGSGESAFVGAPAEDDIPF